jgi:hypothetical protein
VICKIAIPNSSFLISNFFMGAGFFLHGDTKIEEIPQAAAQGGRRRELCCSIDFR